MTSPLLQAGGQPSRAPKYVPIFTNRFFTGLWTQRNPLRDAATPYLYEKFYSGSRFESLIAGSNVELTNRLTLQRRPGNLVYNSQTFPAIDRFYSFRQFTGNSETIAMIADTASTIYDATGPSTKTTIFTKSMGAGQSYFQSVGNVLYFGDGVDQQKYLSNGSAFLTQNWGIANTSASVANVAGAGSNTVGAGSNWTNPNNITNTGVSYATAATFPTNQLQATIFGFAIPASTPISGIAVSVSFKATTTNGYPLTVYLLKNGGVVPVTFKQTVAAGTGLTTVVFGGSNDLWKTTWSATDVNQTGFGFVIIATGTTGTVSINSGTITVYTGASPSVTVSGTAGSLSAANGGYEYEICYGNNLTGPEVISSPTLPSLRTGNFSSKLGVVVPLFASTDTQVTGIHVFRTTDGGSVFLEIPTSPYPNTTQSITDSALDSQLNIFSQAPLQLQNNPPPAGLINCTYHLGRMWGSVGNTVYCSTGPDIINGNPNEAFPPANNFVFPSLVKRLWPNGTSGLLVYTVSDTYVISGTTLSTFYAVPFLNNVGLLSYNAFDVNGSIIYMMTNDGHVLSLDPNSGVSEVGFPIGDLFDTTYSPANTYLAWHVAGSRDKALYVADGSTGWFRMNAAPAPESGIAWSPFATIVGGVQAVQSCEITPGVKKLLLGPATSGPILMRDLATFTDNGSTYTASATIGSVVLAQPGDIAELSFIATECPATGSHPTVALLLDEISGAFESLPIATWESPVLPPSVTIFADRFYVLQGALPALCRHLQLKISFPAEAAQNELLTYTIFGRHLTER